MNYAINFIEEKVKKKKRNGETSTKMFVKIRKNSFEEKKSFKN